MARHTDHLLHINEKLFVAPELRDEVLSFCLEYAPFAALLYRGPDATVEFFNPMAARLSVSNLEIGKSAFRDLPTDRAEVLLKEYRHVLETGERLSFVDKSILGNFYTYERVRVKLSGGEYAVLNFSHETTEHVKVLKEVEKEAKSRTVALSKAYAFVSAVLENIPDMIFVKESKELRFVRFNRAGEELLGYSRDDLIGKNDYDFFPKSQADFFTSKDQSVLASGELSEILEEPVQTRLKGERLLHTKKIPIFDEQGNPEYLLGISEDITDKKRAEADRENLLREQIARAESERALQLRDDFISIAAHELKTPLTALKMQIQLLNRKMPTLAQPLDRSQEKLLDLMRCSQEQLDHFSRLVENLLDVSRLSAAPLLLNRTQFELKALIQRILIKYANELSKAKCEVILQGDAVVGVWDIMRLEQVLVNLLTNAMKYGAGQPITIVTALQADHALINVSDRGIGVSREDQKRIFHRFERAVSTNAFGGFGLGLFITEQIVHAHGGDIEVESEVGQGACFKVRLPRNLSNLDA